MTDKPPRQDEPGKAPNSRGEFILLSILGAFVVVAIIGMMAIDYYGTQRMGDPSRIHNAADR